MEINIQWYPGHMAKTKRELRQVLALVDLVVETRDARIPRSSHNAELARLVAGKPVVTVLTKADLAEAKLTRVWLGSLKDAGLLPVAVDLQRGRGLAQLRSILDSLHESTRVRLRGRGRQDQVLRGVVVGVPNVGKSMLINRLTRRRVVKTGAKPGVTRGKQWVRAGELLQLLDVPGVLWPRFDDPMTGFRLAVTGAISDDVYDYVAVGSALAVYIAEARPGVLAGRYGLSDESVTGTALLEAIGRRWGFLLSGGRIDEQKAAALLLREFRQGTLGRFTLEAPF